MAELDEKFDPVEAAKEDIRPDIGVVQNDDAHEDPTDNRPSANHRDRGSAAGRLRSLENEGESSSKNGNHGSSIGNPLDSQEKSDDTVGKGFTGNTNPVSQVKTYAKRKVAAFLAGLAASALAAVFGFLLMMPLKLLGIVSNIEDMKGAVASRVVEKTANRLLSEYMANEVTDAMRRGDCKGSTARPSCRVLPSGTGYVKGLYKSWSQGRLENKLATRHGIIVDVDGAGRYHLTVGGSQLISDEQFSALQRGDIDLESLDGRDGASRKQIRDTIRSAFEDETRWKRAYSRWQYGKLLEERYHIRRCMAWCDARDDARDKIDQKKLAGKAWFAQRVVGKMSESYGLVAECMLDSASCNNALEASGDESEPRSKVQRELDTRLAAYMDIHGKEKLGDLVKKAGEINEKGMSGYIAQSISEKIAEKFGFGDTVKKMAGKIAGKALPFVGVVSFSVAILDFLDNMDAFSYIAYSTNSAAAVDTFAMYQTTVAEQQAGKQTLNEIGSVTETLEEDVDMSMSPAYKELVDDTSPPRNTSAFTLVLGYLGGDALAAEKDSSSYGITNSTYKCSDGKTVPEGQRACKEMNLTYGGDTVDKLKELRNDGATGALLDGLLGVSSPARTIWHAAEGLLGGAADKAMTAAIKTCDALAPMAAPCSSAKHWMMGKMGELMGWVTNKLISNPYAIATGARKLDMTVAGAEVAYSKSCMMNSGCSEVTPEEYNKQQKEYLDSEQEAFARKPIYARLFSTNTPRSLTVRIALDMPNTRNVKDSLFSNIAINPLRSISKAGLAMTPKGNTSYAVPTAKKSMFGIPQYGFPESKMPKGSLNDYWNKNCEGREYKKEWFSKMNDANKDKATGEARPVDVEPCMLIESAVKAAGAMYGYGDNGAATNNGTVGTLQGGYVFPLKTTQSTILNHSPRWCMDEKWTANCHHDYPAADIFSDPGTEVVAMRGGTVVSVKHNDTSSCSAQKGGSPTLQIKGDDGKYYFYTHFAAGSVVAKPGPIQAGEKLGIVGPTECAQNTDPHVHVQWYTSIINGNSESQDIQAPLLQAFQGLPK